MPKKPVGGGYTSFFAENRAKIAASLPQGHTVTDLAKAIGAQWKALSDAAKKPYVDGFTTAMAEYRKHEDRARAHEGTRGRIVLGFL